MNKLSPTQIEQTPPSSDEDYRLIEDALLQNPRGRWFLEEYVKRNRPQDTKTLLDAIHRIENTLTEKPAKAADDLDPIRMSIIEMSKAIAKTREEIKSIKPEDDSDNQLISASEELGAIVESTEAATNTILEAAEEIQEAAWILREAGAENTTCDTIDTKTTDIYTACSFQDITGQRTTKVVQALCYIENRVNAMIDIWGLDDHKSGTTPRPDESKTRPDAHLLNGPAKLGEELQQDNVDDMLFNTTSEESEAPFVEGDQQGQALADSISFDAIDPHDDPDSAMDAADLDTSDIGFDPIETFDNAEAATSEIAENFDYDTLSAEPVTATESQEFALDDAETSVNTAEAAAMVAAPAPAINPSIEDDIQFDDSEDDDQQDIAALGAANADPLIAPEPTEMDHPFAEAQEISPQNPAADEQHITRQQAKDLDNLDPDELSETEQEALLS